MGFLSQYEGVDIIDLGDGWNVTMVRFLPGDTQDRADAVKMKVLTEASRDKNEKSVKVQTITDNAAYVEVMLMDAIVAWNLTDSYDQVLPLEPPAKKLESIRRLPGPVRTLLMDRIEQSVEDSTRSPEDQKTFRAAGDVSA